MSQNKSVADPADPAAEGWEIHDDQGFIGLVGPIWQRMEGEGPIFGFRAEAKHHNLRNVVQGGMLMTFADRSLGATSRHATGNLPQATVQLDVHFVDRVDIGEFVVARARVIRRTKSLIFMEGALTVGDRTVVVAKGVWKLVRYPA